MTLRVPMGDALHWSQVPEGVGDAIVRMQDEAFDGFGAIVDAIMTQAEARLKVLNRRTRETCQAADLERIGADFE